KSALARYLHANSPRTDGPIVDASCPGLPPGKPDVELFGAERSDEGFDARPSSGLCELAGGGTLVLDDVGQLELTAQLPLAEALQQRAFHRVGSRTRIELEARVLATTSLDLHAAVRGGAFRADLFALLGNVTLTLPPLRDRTVDIPLLAAGFLRELGGVRGPTLADEAVDALQRYAWPGNLRELRNVLERAVLLAGGGIVHAHDLPLPAATGAIDRGEEAPLSLAEVERRHIAAVLQRTNWHQGRSAQLLGISVKTLYRKIREYGFARPQNQASA
ncbi:MAG: sigma-54-dependent Fis family transcriptional regulator, partial [Gemmatimonadetes bacterium]|nr:sigma-54-dependent Fis family transcriptional regulator [Gemmatimonadota bacterium]